jgi:hypothetical protein
MLSFATLTSMACSNQKASVAGQSPTETPDAGDAGTAFQADPPLVYVAKVKNVLVGLPPSDVEIQLVEADPTKLTALIQTWTQLPQYSQKMLRFFQLAFQQTQVSAVDFSDQAYPKQIAINAATTPLLVQNAQESFARTMLELVSAGQPLTDGVTTHQLMMTTALKELYAFLDVWQVDDDGKVADRFKQANKALSITVEAAQGAIPFDQTLDPASPNYMHWYDPDTPNDAPGVSGCGEDPIVLPATGIGLHYLLYGSIDGHKSIGGVQCPPYGGTANAAQLATADFNDWTLVTIRQPKASEAVTAFYDLPKLRGATELVLSIPRVGFFSSPAFFANWQTNTSNQMRVTMNQTLIVALGSAVDGTDPTMTPGNPPPGLDTEHSAVPDCATCHRTLDPLRSIFSAMYSWNYHQQNDASLTAQKGTFSFRGVTQPVTSLDDLGTELAEHPFFAEAWVQKLCYYVNSSPCDRTDPEFLRIVDAFTKSGFGWNALVANLLSSPLVTHAAPTQTSSSVGETVAVSRRDHFCAALNARLGFADVCGLDVQQKKLATVPAIVSGLPSDGYGRGSTAPVLPNAPTLFYRAGIENICASVAAQVVDTAASKRLPNVKQWSSADPDGAIADFVGTIMALVPSDPRAAPAASLLRGHYDAARQQGASASDALKSTFVTACLAPSSVSIGL